MRTLRWWPVGENLESGLPFTGERFTIDQAGEIRVEHLHRYLWANSLRRGGRWIDVASGSGYGTYLLAQESRDVVGFDIDPAAIEVARRIFARSSAIFETASVYSLGIDPGSVDVVVSFETIEHIDEPGRAVAEFARCLTPSGVLVASSPNKSTYSSNRPPHNLFHKFEYYAEEFRDEIEKHFDQVVMFGQWTFGAASVIAPLDSSPTWQDGSFWLNGRHEGISLDPTFEPRYLIAIASQLEMRASLVPSIAVDTFDVEQAHDEVGYLKRELSDLLSLLERERTKALADIEAVKRDVSDLVRLNQHLEEKLMLVKRELGRFAQD
jgi:SAM-dependent methyltransferase